MTLHVFASSLVEAAGSFAIFLCYTVLLPQGLGQRPLLRMLGGSAPSNSGTRWQVPREGPHAIGYMQVALDSFRDAPIGCFRVVLPNFLSVVYAHCEGLTPCRRLNQPFVDLCCAQETSCMHACMHARAGHVAGM